MSRDRRLIKYISRATEMIKAAPGTQLLQKVGFCFREKKKISHRETWNANENYK